MRIASSARAYFYIIARHHEAVFVHAFRELYTMAGTRCIPTPVGLFGSGSYFFWRIPGLSIIGRSADIYTACVFAGACIDLADMIVAVVPGHQQMNFTGILIYDGSGIAAGVYTVAPDHL